MSRGVFLAEIHLEEQHLAPLKELESGRLSSCVRVSKKSASLYPNKGKDDFNKVDTVSGRGCEREEGGGGDSMRELEREKLISNFAGKQP